MRPKWGERNTDSRWEQKGGGGPGPTGVLSAVIRILEFTLSELFILSEEWHDWTCPNGSLCLLVGNKLKGGKHVSGDIIWAWVEPSLWLEGRRILSVVQIEWANRETTIEKITEHFFVKGYGVFVSALVVGGVAESVSFLYAYGD